MASRSRLTIETFLAGCEMVAGHLRLKELDRWTPHVCRLKLASFSAAFPEVDEAQFLWASEQWIQRTDPQAFHRFPVWSELMAPLYRSEEGKANRSWGFRPDLPGFLRPTAEQLAALPTRRGSVLPPADPQNPAAYRTVGLAAAAEEEGRPLLPAALPLWLVGAGVSDDDWNTYLSSLPVHDAESAAPPGQAPADSGKGPSSGVLVDRRVQQGAEAADIPPARIPDKSPRVL